MTASKAHELILKMSASPYTNNVSISTVAARCCPLLLTLKSVVLWLPVLPPPDYLINYWLMPQTCWRQASTQGQRVLVSSVTAGDEDLDGRACQRYQDIKHNGFVAIGLILLSLWRQRLFFAVQRRLAENHPDWQSRAERGLVPVPAGFPRRWTLPAACWLCPLKCANSSVRWVQRANTKGRRDLVNTEAHLCYNQTGYRWAVSHLRPPSRVLTHILPF